MPWSFSPKPLVRAETGAPAAHPSDEGHKQPARAGGPMNWLSLRKDRMVRTTSPATPACLSAGGAAWIRVGAASLRRRDGFGFRAAPSCAPEARAARPRLDLKQQLRAGRAGRCPPRRPVQQKLSRRNAGGRSGGWGRRDASAWAWGEPRYGDAAAGPRGILRAAVTLAGCPAVRAAPLARRPGPLWARRVGRNSNSASSGSNRNRSSSSSSSSRRRRSSRRLVGGAGSADRLPPRPAARHSERCRAASGAPGSAGSGGSA